jgi:hypothetical protein
MNELSPFTTVRSVFRRLPDAYGHGDGCDDPDCYRADEVIE